MANVVVVGMQWGDEGKGKIVDLLCPAFDAVVRYQGGHNAGHTVKFGDRHFALRLIPSGILHSGMRCVMGNGMVVSPEAFFEELEQLEAAGVDIRGRLFLSNRAQALLPHPAAAPCSARARKRPGRTSAP
jgi:adenylosuccinate synthase